jgi:F-type H+-transporting ATPase subunit b
MFTPEAVAGYVTTALFAIIDLLVTYFIVKHFLFKPILKVLRKRKAEVETELTHAEEYLTDAEKKLADATERLNNSSHEATVIITNARTTAESTGENILAEARHEAASMLTRADTEVSRMRVTMLNEVRDEVADLSVAIASKVIGHVMDESRQHEMVDRLVDQEISIAKEKAAKSNTSEVKDNA